MKSESINLFDDNINGNNTKPTEEKQLVSSLASKLQRENNLLVILNKEKEKLLGPEYQCRVSGSWLEKSGKPIGWSTETNRFQIKPGVDTYIVTPFSGYGKSYYLRGVDLASLQSKVLPQTSSVALIFSSVSLSKTEELIRSSPNPAIRNVIICASGSVEKKNMIFFPADSEEFRHYRLGYSKIRGHYAFLKQIGKLHRSTTKKLITDLP